jgi:hypothetical protein
MNDHTTSDEVRLLRQWAEREPPPEAMQRAIERTREALVARAIPGNKPLQQPERRGVPRWMRWSATISVVAAMCLGGTFFAFFAKSGTGSALAEVQRAIQQVSCVSFSMETIQVPKSHPEMIFQTDGTGVQEFAGRRHRFESADGESIRVHDLERGIFMDLRPTEKRASIWHQDSNVSRHPTFAEFLERLRSGKVDKVERLVDGTIDGRTVFRYRIPPESRLSGGTEVLVSVDPMTFLPVRIESKTDAFGLPPLHIVVKDFSYEPRDPSLFAIVPPEGYEVHVYPEDETTHEPVPLREQPIDLGRPTVAIELRLAEREPAEGLIEATISGKTPLTIYLHPEPIVENQHIQNIQSWEILGSDHSIVIEFTEAGRARMAEATSKDLPRRLALLIDGQVVSAPRVFAAISDKAQVAGLSSEIVRRLTTSADHESETR